MTIAEYIRDDLVARISAGGITDGGRFTRGEDLSLTLGGIASHYSVSITPVRIAVQALIEEGILRKGANRRLGINQGRANDRVASMAASPDSGATDNVTGSDKKMIDPVQEISDYTVRLSVEGETVFLREEATAKQFGISRSAVRQIFTSLAGHGMIEHIPRRGWQIRPLRANDLDEYIEVRIPLEIQALQLARPHLVDDDIRKLLYQNRLPETPTDEPLTDDSLHRYIIQKAGNRYLADFFERHSKYFNLLFNWEVLDRETRVQTVRQHRDILEAILCKDWPLAESALEFHIQHNHPLLRKRIRDQLSKK